MSGFDQRQYVQLKSNLTRAVNKDEPGKIIDECIRALAIFEATGYPDDWMRWHRAAEDALLQARKLLDQRLF